MASKLIYGLHDQPIIAAINDELSLEDALMSSVEVIFLLKGNILNLKTMIKKIKLHDKCVFVHADLIDGLSKDVNGLNYIIDEIQPDGIITTKAHLIKIAKSKGIMAIQRLFILDSLNLKTGIESAKKCDPDAIEILPGIMPSITKEIISGTHKPVIAGGLIRSKEDVISSLKAGAIGISTSNKSIWEM